MSVRPASATAASLAVWRATASSSTTVGPGPSAPGSVGSPVSCGAAVTPASGVRGSGLSRSCEGGRHRVRTHQPILPHHTPGNSPTASPNLVCPATGVGQDVGVSAPGPEDGNAGNDRRVSPASGAPQPRYDEYGEPEDQPTTVLRRPSAPPPAPTDARAARVVLAAHGLGSAARRSGPLPSRRWRPR